MDATDRAQPTSHPATGGVVMARGAAANALALAAANLRALFTLLVARLLGQAVLGSFGLAFATTDLLSKVATLGLDNASMALVAKARGVGETPRRLITSALRLGSIASVATAALAVPTVLALGPPLGQPQSVVRMTALLLLSLPAVALYRIANGVSRGFGVMRHDIYSRGLAETWTTIFVFLLAYAAGVGALSPALAVVAGAAAGAFVAWRLARGLYAGLREPAGGRSERDLAAFALPIAVYGVLNILIMRLDVLVLGVLVATGVSSEGSGEPVLTLASFGAYCAAAEVTGGLRKVRQIFEPALAPQAAVHALGPGDSLRATLGQTGRWVVAGLLPLIGVLLLSGGLLLGAFGPGFREGAGWLALLALAQGVSALAGLAETVIMVRRPALNVLNSFLVAAIQLAATALLARRLGATGAALGTLLAYSLLALLRFSELRAAFGIAWPFASLLRPTIAFAASFAPAVAVRVLIPGLSGEAAAALVLLAGYALAWWRLGLDPADRETLVALRSRRAAARATCTADVRAPQRPIAT